MPESTATRSGPKTLAEMEAPTLRWMVQLLRLRVRHLENQLARQEKGLLLFGDTLNCEPEEEQSL